MSEDPVYTALVPFLSETMIAMFALMICAFVVADIEVRSRWSRIKPLVPLGEWSYAFHLIHATLICLALEYVGQQQGSVGLVWVVAFLIVSITCAWVLHVFIERPVESRLRNKQNGVVDRRRHRPLAESRSDDRRAGDPREREDR